jgi:protein-S-isoprenylcysteine O-methyltransferase Ste14
MALIINAGLLTVFAVQHSVMARPAFKQMLVRFLPQPAERSTYVLLSSLALVLLFWQWRPIDGVVWQVTSQWASTTVWILFAAGWVTVLVTTFLINHFDLFGLRQGWLYFQAREYTSLRFTMPGPYRFVRHPLYVGWLLAFWATPSMSMAHLFFAVGTTAYILVAIQLEERDLVAAHGESYLRYREDVPMLVPTLSKRGARLSAKSPVLPELRSSDGA